MHLLILATAFVWLVLPERAGACSVPPPGPFAIEADPSDITPPSTPRVELSRVKRGKGPEREGCGQTSTSCDDIAYVLLDVEVPSAEGELGYVIETRGDAPAFYAPQGVPFSWPLEPGQLRLHWSDGEGEAGYAFELLVWSVDHAGNMSEEPLIVRVESGGAGCHALGSRAQGAWLMLLLVLLVWRQRSHRAPSPTKLGRPL